MQLNEYGFADAKKAVELIRNKTRQQGMNPDAIKDGIILGSGLGNFTKDYLEDTSTDGLSSQVIIPYAEIYKSLGRLDSIGELAGHSKQLIIAPLKGTSAERLVLVLAGREHPYEGVSGRRATFFLRVMQLLGVQTLLGSNAAGIITPNTLEPPALVLTHSNEDLAISADSPLIGVNEAAFGPRFPHLLDLYPAKTRQLIKKVAQNLNIPLKEGTYIRFKGPNYESPEEISRVVSMLENMWRIGKSRQGEERFSDEAVGVVGMSSTYEALVLQHATQSTEYPAFLAGRAFISVATNYAGSVGPDGFVEASTHDEVKENAAIVQDQFCKLVKESILELRKES